ncbi:MAG: hypothetical protein IPM29_25295 [Planctomycetes bacterium]|nr:hypothetical protein [Planctomycetota bacterium]
MTSRPTDRAPRARRRLGSLGIALGLLLALVTFELLLQGIAFALWLGGDRSGGAADGRQVVLCVGDSNTYGVGAASPDGSYPARLQRLLDARAPGAWRVVNGAYPGQNSRQVLLKLPAQLASLRPRLVYVLVGTNDEWSSPAPVAAAELDAARADGGFPLRLRTLRFAALVWAWLRGGGPATVREQTQYLGTWHVPETGIEVVIEDGGRFVLGGHDMTWRPDGDELVVTLPDGSEHRLGWERVDAGLHLRGPSFGDHVLLPGPAPAQNRTGNEHYFVDEAPPRDAAELDARFAAVVERIREEPSDLAAWRRLAALPLEQRHWDEFGTLMEQLLAGSTDDYWRSGLLRGLSLLPRTPRDVALRRQLEASCIDGKGGPVVLFLQTMKPPVERAEYEAAVAAVAGADTAERERLRQLYAQYLDPFAGFAGVLDHNLRLTVERCRAAGAEPVLVDYPLRIPIVDDVMSRIANDLGVGYVPVGTHFATLLQSQGYAELFVPGAHCNDHGYEVLAARIFDDLCARVPELR